MKNFTKILFIVVLILPINLFASQTNGTIESGNKNALVCHSVDCATPTPGVVNFLPTGTTPVTISDTDGIDGVAWGNEIGWINFDPTGAEGLTIDTTTGIVSGKAWSQVSGWINFSVTGQTVKINTDGEFEGWAWTGGPYGGWIKFDCNTVGACVKTDWRPLSARTVVFEGAPTAASLAGSGGSTSANDTVLNNQNDICQNIIGYQDKIPTGYSKDEGGLCLLSIDYCKNIEGVQLTIPSKYVLNGSGQCILLTDENKSEFIPDPQTMTTELIETYDDYCPNLFGLQSKLPDGFYLYNNQCVPQEVDYCPNMLGEQYEIPKDMKISNDGQCVKMSNEEIEEINSIQNANNTNRGVKVLGFSFIPDMFKIPLTIPFLKGLFGVTYQVDLFSIIIVVMLLLLIIYFVTNRIRKTA